MDITKLGKAILKGIAYCTALVAVFLISLGLVFAFASIETIRLASQFNPIMSFERDIWLDVIKTDPTGIMIWIMFLGALFSLVTYSVVYILSLLNEMKTGKSEDFFSDDLIWSILVLVPSSMYVWLDFGVEYTVHTLWKEAQLLDNSSGYYSYLANFKNKTRFHPAAEKRLLELTFNSSVHVNDNWGLGSEIETCISGYLYKNNLEGFKVIADIRGEAISAQYKQGFSRFTAYTGASISGMVSINTIKYKFKFEVEPSGQVIPGARESREEAPVPELIGAKLQPFLIKLLEETSGRKLPTKIKCQKIW